MNFRIQTRLLCERGKPVMFVYTGRVAKVEVRIEASLTQFGIQIILYFFFVFPPVLIFLIDLRGTI